MGYGFGMYREAADSIRKKLGDFRPEALMILGSGLGALGDGVEDPVYVPYSEVPHMKSSTAPGHQGRFVFGRLAGRRVAVMQGRIHCYEGYSMEDVSFPVRVLKLLGAGTLIVTNAAGCVNREWEVGDLMLITDHIRLFGFGPLCGPNADGFGPRFPDISKADTPRLQKIAREAAREQDITLREGVYMYFPGPQYETPAEIRAARLLGADAVGMSTVPEVTVASHAGYETVGITLCTNMAAGILEEPLTAEEVLEKGREAAPRFAALILRILELM